MNATIRFHLLDIRALLDAGREPLPEIQRRVATLAANEGLRVVAPFLPAPLIERLKGEGFSSRFERSGADWHVWFWRDDAP